MPPLRSGRFRARTYSSSVAGEPTSPSRTPRCTSCASDLINFICTLGNDLCLSIPDNGNGPCGSRIGVLQSHHLSAAPCGMMRPCAQFICSQRHHPPSSSVLVGRCAGECVSKRLAKSTGTISYEALAARPGADVELHPACPSSGPWSARGTSAPRPASGAAPEPRPRWPSILVTIRRPCSTWAEPPPAGPG